MVIRIRGSENLWQLQMEQTPVVLCLVCVRTHLCFDLAGPRGFGTICWERRKPPEGDTGISAFHVDVCLSD